MAEFQRSRLEKKAEDEITRKTIFLGLLTVIVFGLLIIFGLPLLIKFSIILGDIKNQKAIETKEKSLPPMAPRIILPFEATNSSQIIINGLAEKNVTVELLKNDVSIGKEKVNDVGEFTFGNVLLDQGESIFTAIAINDKGGSGEPSKELKVIFDNVPPTLTMLNPSEESLKVDSADFDVIGQSEKGVGVLINGRVAMVDDTGKFKLKLQLNTGKNNVEIIVRDVAGNETKKNISITYDI
jgi:hypothetical protein